MAVRSLLSINITITHLKKYYCKNIENTQFIVNKWDAKLKMQLPLVKLFLKIFIKSLQNGN